jgi:hypothetical protein
MVVLPALTLMCRIFLVSFSILGMNLFGGKVPEFL